MHDTNHEHRPAAAAKNSETVTDLEKLKKMVEHWIGHNEEHARSYLLWAGRAKEAGRTEPGEILEDIAGEMIAQNRKLERIIAILDKPGGAD